jgi:hypothetical protein
MYIRRRVDTFGRKYVNLRLLTFLCSVPFYGMQFLCVDPCHCGQFYWQYYHINTITVDHICVGEIEKFSSSFRHFSVRKVTIVERNIEAIRINEGAGNPPTYKLPQSSVKINKTFHTLTFLVLARFQIFKLALMKMLVVSRCRLRNNYRRQVETSRNT